MEKDLIRNSSFDGDFEKYEKSFVEVLNIHASRKVKVIGNQKLH